MKKVFALLLSLAMVLSLMAGCGSSSTESSASEGAAAASSAEASAEEVQEEADEADEEAEVPADDSEAGAEAAEEEAEEKGEFVAASASLPLAENESLTYFVELPGYMSMFNVNSYDDIAAFQYAEEITGVDIIFTIVNSESYQTNFQLMVASGDITDLTANSSDQYSSSAAMIEDGVAIDLMEYQDELSNYFAALNYYSEYWTSAVSQEGYMVEAITIADDYKQSSGLQIREDWLEKLGMDVPTTFDELYEALSAFKTEFGADQALLLTGDIVITGSSLVGGFGSAGYSVSDGSNNMWVKDGVVQNGLLDDGFKEYMEMIAQWYAEGLIGTDFATESNDPFTSNADSYIQGGNAGVWSAQSDNMDSNMSAGQELDPDYSICAMAEITVDDEIFHFGSSTVGTSSTGKNVAISECCENLELALAWIDFWYTDEGIILANYGIEGEGLTYDADGNPCLSDLVLYNDEFPMISFATTYYTLACVPTLQDYDRTFAAYSDANLAAMDLWSSTEDDLYTLPAQVELTADESADYSSIWSDLSTYANTEVFKFVMGEYNFDEDWDSFIAEIKNKGLQDCIDIYQAAYDRYAEAYLS